MSIEELNRRYAEIRQGKKKKDDYKANRDKCFMLAEYRCELCGSTFRLTCHHKVARWRGKGDKRLHDTRNLMCVCVECHQKIEQYKTGYEQYKLKDFDF
jgi:5-methylcytosine-specific restriction endonuclease McrA